MIIHQNKDGVYRIAASKASVTDDLNVRDAVGIDEILFLKRDNISINDYNDDRLLIASNCSQGKHIPYIIHLVWFGDKLPVYAINVIEAYAKINGQFLINVICRKSSDLHEKTDDVLLEAAKKDLSEAKNGNTQCRFYEKIDYALKNKMSDDQIIIDVYRFRLLDHFGGIYVDFDTWPLRNFGDLMGFPVIYQRVCNFRRRDSEQDFLSKDSASNALVFQEKFGGLQSFLDDFLSFEDSFIAQWNDIYMFGVPSNGISGGMLEVKTGLESKFPSPISQTYFKLYNYGSDFIEQFKRFNAGEEVDVSKLDFYKKFYIIHFNNVNWA